MERAITLRTRSAIQSTVVLSTLKRRMPVPPGPEHDATSSIIHLSSDWASRFKHLMEIASIGLESRTQYKNLAVDMDIRSYSIHACVRVR
jgi:hypothetical protein